jgi:DNA helicase TIP49 (TBP-interacting protein)
MNINTKDMTEDELKAFLKERARAEGIDLTDQARIVLMRAGTLYP